MTVLPCFDDLHGRRRFLTLIGGAASVAVAGCTGATDDPDDGGDANGPNDDEGTSDGSCDTIRGPMTSFDPGDRWFPYLFEHPETFEEYNSEINESESAIGAQLGHVASSRSTSYPVNLSIHQHKEPITDETAAENWVTSFATGERLDGTFTADGEEITVYEDTSINDPTAAVWRFLLPDRESDGVRGISVQFVDDRSENDCFDALVGVARDLIESLTPNPK